MLQLVLIFVIIAPLLWVDVRLFRAMRRRGARWNWWVLLGVFALGGFIASGFLMSLEYPLSADWCAHGGFPIPVGFFHLEKGVWVDYSTPLEVPAVIANGVFFVLISVLLCEAAFFVFHRRRQSATGDPRP